MKTALPKNRKIIFVLLAVMLLLLPAIVSAYDYNSIMLPFSASVVDGNILATIFCSQNNMKVDINFRDSADTAIIFDVYDASGTPLGAGTPSFRLPDCNATPASYLLKPRNPLTDNAQYRLIASTPKPCKDCFREAFFYYKPSTPPATVPDNEPILAILVLAAVVAVIASKRAKKAIKKGFNILKG